MINTPLLLDFSGYVYPAPYSITVPTTEAQLDLITTDVIGSPEYYIKVFPPANAEHQNIIKQSAFQFNIPSYPSLNYQVRLALPPSIGYGINSCYRVEYWEWRKPYKQGEPYNSPTSRAIKTKLSEQYWRIPTVDSYYLLSERDYYIYKPRFKYTSNTTFTQTGNTLNLLNNLDIIVIQSVISNGTLFTNYSLQDDSLFWKPYFAPLVPDNLSHPTAPTVQLLWGTGTIPNVGDIINIEYANPFSLENIIYVDTLDVSIIDMPVHYINPYLF